MSVPFAVWAAVLGSAWAAIGAAWGVRYLTGGERKEISAKIAAEGGRVIWIKRLEWSTAWPALLRTPLSHGRVTTYDVLVERDGVRRIEVWRNGEGGVAKDH
jgi:hypothetical protein